MGADEALSGAKSTGEWAPVPWFADPKREHELGREWSALGLSLQARQDADRALRRLFPPEFVRALLSAPIPTRDQVLRGEARELPLFGGVVGLLEGMYVPSRIAELLDLGVNSARTSAYEDEQMVARLQLRDQHEPAAFEVGLHAALRRGGANVEAVSTSSSSKTPDFRVNFRNRNYDIEAKLMLPASVDRFAEMFSIPFSGYDFFVPGFRTTLRASQSLAELVTADAREARKRIPEILRAFGAAATSAREAKKPGDYAAEPWGAVELRSGPELGSFQLAMPDLTPRHRAARVASAIRKKLGQLNGGRLGVIVIGLYGEAEPDDVERLILAEPGTAIDLAKTCRMVVLLDKFRGAVPKGAHVHSRLPAFYAFSPLLTRELDVIDRKLAAAIASTHWAKALAVDVERTGQISLRHNNDRQHTSSVVGQLTLEPGMSQGTMTIRRVNGRLVSTVSSTRAK